MKKIFALILMTVLMAGVSYGAPTVRIKDIAHVLQARDNQLMGFGLVVGLRNTGDTQQTGFTKQAITNLLSKMGVAPQLDFKSRNVAAVMVTADLPPYAKSGQKLDVTVSSMGDATSLAGGTLLFTPLTGADSDIYATAQGNITVGQDSLAPNLPPLRTSQATVGSIPGGALIEKEVPVSLADKGNISIVLDEPDFTTAARVADAISKLGFEANAVDASTIQVPVYSDTDAVKVVSRIEGVTITPDSVARIVVNERTGTIVVGENVKISEAAVTSGTINVTIGSVRLHSEGSQDQNAGSTLGIDTTAKVTQDNGNLVRVPQSAKLSDVVKALNAVKATPQDLISIMQALKKVGALKAELEVI
ncbi:MAG TPA: flagellar basal body P-ring protein FlgI [Candidatus Omnitrophota bacterium]|nr:flagellar basal body P-ring protein FlgI [Candidatus Omnitrophota bacterium]